MSDRITAWVPCDDIDCTSEHAVQGNPHHELTLERRWVCVDPGYFEETCTGGRYEDHHRHCGERWVEVPE